MALNLSTESPWHELSAGDRRYVLYGRPGSVSAVPQMALEEIGVPYEKRWLGTDVTDLAEYRRLHPQGRVPTLIFPSGLVVFETAAICTLLAYAHPVAALAPAPGSAESARFIQWMIFLSSSLYEVSRRGYRAAEMSVAGEAAASDIRAKAQAEQLAVMRLLDSQLSPYVLQSGFSAADLYLHQLMQWFMGPIEQLFSECAACERHWNLLQERSSVRKVQLDHGH